MGQVLVLNASYEPLNVTSVRRAHVLVFKGKAEVIEELDRPLRSAASTFRWPHVIRLVHYVRVPRAIQRKISRRALFARDGWRCVYCGTTNGRLAVESFRALERRVGDRLADHRPGLQPVRGDLERVRSVYLSSLAHVTAAMLLPLSILCALAPAFVHAVYGPQWSAAGPVVRLFALIAAVPIVTTTATWLLASQGRATHLLLSSLASAALVAVGFVVGLRWGLVGLATAYAVATLAFGVPFAAFAFHSVGLPLRRAAKGLLGPLLAWAEAVAVGILVDAAWPGTGSWGLLAAGGAACAASYLLVLWVVDKPLLHSLRNLPDELRVEVYFGHANRHDPVF